VSATRVGPHRRVMVAQVGRFPAVRPPRVRGLRRGDRGQSQRGGAAGGQQSTVAGQRGEVKASVSSLDRSSSFAAPAAQPRRARCERPSQPRPARPSPGPRGAGVALTMPWLLGLSDSGRWASF
jgi:hypothetical protein